jgi:hypothetical protein
VYRKLMAFPRKKTEQNVGPTAARLGPSLQAIAARNPLARDRHPKRTSA